MTFLKLSRTSKSYGGTKALIDARLAIEAGEVHALMGENGAGKSTLIKILAGIEMPDRMDLKIDGTDATLRSPQDAEALGFRFIHQELNIVPQLSVAENILLGHAYPLRAGIAIDWKKLNELATEALARLRIDHIDTARKAGRLSLGDQMLIKIASTLVSAPGEPAARLYVMDEPTAALTGAESEKLFAVIDELRKSGASVLYVSHRLEEVMNISDRVTVFRDGTHIATRPIAETSREEIIREMTGRAVRDAYPERTNAIDEATLLAVEKAGTTKVTGLDFTLRRGEILGLAGLEGAGQSQALEMLMGLSPLKSGTIRLDGTPLGRHGPLAAWMRHIAYVPRERRREGLMLGRSVLENVALPHWGRLSRAGGMLADTRAARKTTRKLAETVRLKSAGLSQVTRTLSGGNQQKVVFARALGATPKLLLLDEPTRGVDVGAKYDIYRLVRQLSEKGCSVIITSSDLPELLGLCDRILIMRDGRQNEIVAARELDPAALLERLYGQASPPEAAA